ncbi:ATP-dependent RNA helicase HrpA [Ectothiorhodospira variabilis]|uniref:ATP-dependent RNA helicase HrpA n=1 Tax=Ectothiorhodospira variabilis TaxID=505694 RepID=UPI001EFA7EA3|nr:ATP-dependent RNA helicase HrpA [Ectothiorhodospira variabilis]MCG5495206.1 ATP-dependent RNA helicase HrpA [Ectothiorhodospira variabilis]MCG5504244.1 ATP-dependent RNA helicase HrpA [Ectothiorhodospira variabilis]MCG5507399.1 ATP-dependent RNA helicase HrpA [Ectothiorhodospira variabilis]
MSTPSPDTLLSRLPHCLAPDRPTLAKDVDRLRRRLNAGKPADRLQTRLEQRIQASTQAREQRLTALPKPDFPEDLPVSAHRDEIAKLITQHQVVVICGETGSGKTTQLPKICLSLGRGVDGLIGHTQPRRIAARSVANRIAEELHGRVGETVGFKVRFSDHVGPRSHIKLMTDGILLAELRSDPDLTAYDTLIIDEAHERSLNIDFLLGYLKRLLPRRPDLKLIITSATLAPELIAGHFDNAPIYTVPGRTYPVEVRYRPVTGDDDADTDRDLNDALLQAVDELAAEGRGDILVFLPGEREIREAAEALRKHHPKHTEILPLYARLSAAEQNKVFAPHTGRRVVLATNVAETALTVPGIRYVIDSGLARVARYAWRSRVQRLSLEPISQASANQRAGRCGRLGPGICVRLYAEEDFALRPEYTDPEILRSNLASVILQMAHLNLGDPEQFPFVEPPDTRLIRDGFKLLETLQAVDGAHRITDVGRQLARLPVDPMLGAMLLAGAREQALAEVNLIVSLLAIQDPRERPADKRQAADEAHARYREPGSDFLSYLNLWKAWREQSRHLSQSKLRAWCREEFISFLRMREWQDLHGQLRQHLNELGLKENQEPAEPAAIHRALLTGLVNQIGVKTERGDYLGARNRRFHIHPGSGLFKGSPGWVMAAEIAETTRVYARECAAIRPDWLETVAGHLLKHHYFDPHFEPRRGTVGAYDRITLHGLIINPKRKVNYGRVAPEDARQVFIREGLVAGRLRSRAEALVHNRDLIQEIEDLEARGRRRDLLADEQVLYDFYDSRLPAKVHDAASFERWRKQAEREDPSILHLDRDTLLQRDAPGLDADQFPDSLHTSGLRLPLSYHFDPGHEADGVTLTVPLAALNALDPDVGDWLVPGLLEEKVTALIKSLPKAIRRHFVPAPEFAKAALGRMGEPRGPLIPAISRALREITGTDIPLDEWHPDRLEPHLILRYRVVDAQGQQLTAGRDLEALKAELSGHAQESFEEHRPEGFEREGITQWDFGPLEESVEFEQHGATLKGYPALEDRGDSVARVIIDSPVRARATHRAGLRRLFMLGVRDQVKYLYRHLPDIQRLCLQYNAVDRCEVLKDDLVFAAVERVFMAEPWPRDAEAFEARLEAGRSELVGQCNELCEQLGTILAAYQGIRSRLKGALPLSWIEAAGDVRDQLDHLIYPHFLLETPPQWLARYPQYLAGIERRLERLDQAPDKDRRARVDIEPLWEDCKARLKAGVHPEREAELQRYRWRIEELRLSLFAQEIRTVEKVSVKRLEEDRKALDRA